MNLYIIACGDAYIQSVAADNSENAIAAWMDDQGYDSLLHAATENFCDLHEIKAILVGVAA